MGFGKWISSGKRNYFPDKKTPISQENFPPRNTFLGVAWLTGAKRVSGRAARTLGWSLLSEGNGTRTSADGNVALGSTGGDTAMSLVTWPESRVALMWVGWDRFQWRPHAGHCPSTLSHTARRVLSAVRAKASGPFLRSSMAAWWAGSWSSRPEHCCFPHTWNGVV